MHCSCTPLLIVYQALVIVIVDHCALLVFCIVYCHCSLQLLFFVIFVWCSMLSELSCFIVTIVPCCLLLFSVTGSLCIVIYTMYESVFFIVKNIEYHRKWRSEISTVPPGTHTRSRLMSGSASWMPGRALHAGQRELDARPCALDAGPRALHARTRALMQARAH